MGIEGPKSARRRSQPVYQCFLGGPPPMSQTPSHNYVDPLKETLNEDPKLATDFSQAGQAEFHRLADASQEARSDNNPPLLGLVEDARRKLLKREADSAARSTTGSSRSQDGQAPGDPMTRHSSDRFRRYFLRSPTLKLVHNLSFPQS
jgi:hypothetical protein